MHTAPMGKRKVTTSRTNRIGRQSVTRTYVHDDSPGRISRFAAFTGISPWDGRRFTVAAWIFVLLMVFGQSVALGWVLLGLSAAVLVVRYVRARTAEVEQVPPKSVPVGPAWCDHCADWTVHASEEHKV